MSTWPFSPTAVGGGGGPDPINEVEPNDTIGGAQNIDGAGFNLDVNANIFSSTTIPHITVLGTGDGTFDYYAFTIDVAGSTSFSISMGPASTRNCSCSAPMGLSFSATTMRAAIRAAVAQSIP